jgi:hypothetical protein
MAKFLKFSLLLLVVGAVVWLATLWRWHSRGFDPSGLDLLIYLVASPLALTGGLVFGAWQINKIALFAMAPLNIGSVAPAAPEATTGSEPPEQPCDGKLE